MTPMITLITILATASQPPAPGRANTNRATQEQPQRQSDQAKSPESLTNGAVPPQVSIAPTFVQNSPTPNQSNNGSGTTADWWMVGLTFLIAIATFVLAANAITQFKAQTRHTTEALALAREANEQAAQDRQRAVDTDTKLVHAANMATMFQQRSRVGVTHAKILGPLGPDSPLVGQIAVRNWAGKPAQPSRYCITWRVGELPIEPVYPPDREWVHQDRLLYVQAGKVFMRQTMSGQLSPDEWAQIQTGELPLYVYGRVDYVSMMNPHYSGFCRRYNHVLRRFVHQYAPKYNRDT